jgi:DNA-binding LytR/AlgR family response regulator
MMNSTHPTALIAEDEPLLAENLRVELARLWPELQVLGCVSHGQAAVDQALALEPSICFLDIRMPGLSGLEAAAAMAEDWADAAAPFPLLVFVTAYDQYALQAFDHAAVDYVLKPVQPARLAQTVLRLKAALARRQLTTNSAPTGMQAAVDQLRALLGAPVPAAPTLPTLRLLQIGVGQSVLMVPVDEVLYFEAADKYVRVLTADKEHLIRLSLRDLLPQLDGQRFWQIHRSVVVRAEAIQRAVRDDTGRLTLHLHGRDERLAVSRLYAHLFKSM